LVFGKWKGAKKKSFGGTDNREKESIAISQKTFLHS